MTAIAIAAIGHGFRPTGKELLGVICFTLGYIANHVIEHRK